MLNFLKPTKKGFIGIQLTRTHAYMVELSGSEDKPTVERYSVSALPAELYTGSQVQDQEKLGEVLEKAMANAGFTKKPIAIALPSNLMIIKEFNMDNGLSEQDKLEAVTLEVQNTVPLDIDEIYIDYKILGEGSTPDSVTVGYAVSKKQHVDEYVGALEVAGLVTRLVDSDHNAMLHAVDSIRRFQMDKISDTNIMVLDIGMDKCEYLVFRDDKLLWTREHHICTQTLIDTIISMYAVDPSEAYKMALHPARYASSHPQLTTDVIQPYVDSIALEVMRHIEMFEEAGVSFGIEHILIAGSLASLEGLDETIQTRTTITSSVANPLGHCTLSSKIDPDSLMSDAPALMVAVGMALRTFE